jgi:uncharacterized membrane protein YgcG
MKSFKEFTTNCPPGYRFDKKLGYCVPKGKRHINYIVGARYLSDHDEEEKKNGNGNGNGNGESDGGGDGGGGE